MPQAGCGARVLAPFPLLAERSRQPAGLLSGRTQHRLVIGRALMAGPELLLPDEPSAGLTPLVVGQSVSAALEIVDRACALGSSPITLAGPAWKTARDPAVTAACLGG
jgi:branched-chain amino acid transport system ATP-binding protein